jgi:hypothetical protein
MAIIVKLQLHHRSDVIASAAVTDDRQQLAGISIDGGPETGDCEKCNRLRL